MVSLRHAHAHSDDVERDVPTVGYNRFKEDFEVLGPLGRGGFGEVWRCRDLRGGGECAIKVVRFRGGATRGARQIERHALREVSTLRLMDHPNVVGCHGAWMERAAASGPAGPTPQGNKPNSSHDAALERPGCPPTPSTWRHAEFSATTPSGCEFHPPTSQGEESVVLFLAEGDEAGLPPGEGAAKPPTREETSRDCADAQPKKRGGRPGRQEEDCAEDITLYIQLELCSEGNLQGWIASRNAMCKGEHLGRETRCLQSERALSVFIQCARALSHMHERACVHRDVKPANIFFAPDGVVRLGDFGLAKLLRSPEEANAVPRSEPSGAGDATKNVGTLSYASPEQLAGGTLGPATDVFALGFVLLELCCPFETQMERALVLEGLRERREVPIFVATTFPTLAQLILAMTEPDQSKRPTASGVLRIAEQASCEARRAHAVVRSARTNPGAAADSNPRKPGRCAAKRGGSTRCSRSRRLHRCVNARRVAAPQRRSCPAVSMQVCPGPSQMKVSAR